MAEKRGRPQRTGACRLSFRPIRYRYRYCSNCRREWPAKHSSCPQCLRWLGEAPLERGECQVFPTLSEGTVGAEFELAWASPIILRALANELAEDALFLIDEVLAEAFEPEIGWSRIGVAEQGWFAWTITGPRSAFLQAHATERALLSALETLKRRLPAISGWRWGMWLDQYIIRFHEACPTISRSTAEAIFNFEPDDVALCSETIFEKNRQWESFVCIPRRLVDGNETQGYRLLGHKRPSALDHAQIAHATPFVDREEVLTALATCWRAATTSFTSAALVAPAGSGKTRLIKEWVRRTPELRVLSAGFSLFGGDLLSFAGQLVELPPAPITTAALVEATGTRIEDEAINVLVLDDLHWADAESAGFLSLLLHSLDTRPMLVILITRPNGRALVQSLPAQIVLDLDALPAAHIFELATQLTGDESLAAIAARYSMGNPLFVEHFVAWAKEESWSEKDDAPRSLHSVIGARITYLAEARLAQVRQHLRWGAAWDRDSVQREIDGLEKEIGRWLDRLETGDYGDRVEVADHLSQLERIEFEIFLASTLAGKARPRSNRLREAIERLMVASASELLQRLQGKSLSAEGPAEQSNIVHQALSAGAALVRRYEWRRASEFYSLAAGLADHQQAVDINRRIDDCQRHLVGPIVVLPTAAAGFDLDVHPAVDALMLPEVWSILGHCYQSSGYFRRAAAAAEAINDTALAAWARQQAVLCSPAGRGRDVCS